MYVAQKEEERKKETLMNEASYLVSRRKPWLRRKKRLKRKRSK
jgi:hypothetical protein